MRLRDLGERDDWACWVCRGRVDPAAPAGLPASGSIDHVVPRAKGGTSDPANLRLAHRRCNGRRGSRLPELEWPPELAALDPAPLWPVVQRAMRRPGEWEVVGLLPTPERAAAAQRWLSGVLPEVLGGAWEVQVGPAGASLHLLRVRAVPATAPPAGAVPSRFSPLAGHPRRRKRGRA